MTEETGIAKPTLMDAMAKARSETGVIASVDCIVTMPLDTGPFFTTDMFLMVPMKKDAVYISWYKSPSATRM